MDQGRPAHGDARFDVAIVGAGPAGLAAAAAALEGGARVVVIDAADQPGGQYWRHRSERAGLPDGGDLHHDWDTYLLLRSDFDRGLRDGTLTYLAATSVWMAGAEPDAGFALFLAPAHGGGRARVPRLAASRLVLATGAYDRQLPVPGWDLPGVMTAGGIQGFIKQNGEPPGRRFVVAGTGPFLLPVATNIVQAGGRVAAVCEAASLGGWVPRAQHVAAAPEKMLEGAGYARVFARHRIRYRTRTVVTAIYGDNRVEAVRIARVGTGSKEARGSGRILEGIDGVGLGWGFTPQLELAVQLGAETRVDADGSLVAAVDDAQRSSVPGLFIAGELTGVGGAALAVLEGRVAGRIAAAEATVGGTAACQEDGAAASTGELRSIQRQRAFARAMHEAHPVPSGWQDRLTPDTIVCRCEDTRVGEILEATTELAGGDARTVKGITRAGMGWCQGRVCGFAVSCLSSDSGSVVPADDSLRQTVKRPIAQPIPLNTLLGLDAPADPE